MRIKYTADVTRKKIRFSSQKDFVGGLNEIFARNSHNQIRETFGAENFFFIWENFSSHRRTKRTSRALLKPIYQNCIKTNATGPPNGKTRIMAVNYDRPERGKIEKKVEERQEGKADRTYFSDCDHKYLKNLPRALVQTLSLRDFSMKFHTCFSL